MYELTGKLYTLSTGGEAAHYFEHRRRYVKGIIRDPRDIQDLHEWAKEYYDEVIVRVTQTDLDFKNEVKRLRGGYYDDNGRMYSSIREAAKLRGRRVLQTVEHLIEKSRKRVEKGKPSPKAVPLSQFPPKKTNDGFDDTVITLPSGESNTYFLICHRLWALELTDRNDIKAVIDISKSRGERGTYEDAITLYWYDELAAAYMNGLLCYAYVCDRALIDRIKRIARRKKDNPILDRGRSEAALKFRGVDWGHEKPIEEWSVFDD